MDDLIARHTSGPKERHPEGPFPAVCVDVIDMGMRVSKFQEHEKATQSVALVFWTGEKSTQGFALNPSREFNFSLHEKANLSKFLEAWRGKPFTDVERTSGVSLRTLVGKPCLLSIVHTDKGYANIGTIMPLPKQMSAPEPSGYLRAPFWAMNKEKYAIEYKIFLRDGGGDVSYEGPAEGSSSADDDIPF